MKQEHEPNQKSGCNKIIETSFQRLDGAIKCVQLFKSCQVVWI